MIGRAVFLAVLVLAATMGACDRDSPSNNGSGLSLYFFAGGLGGADGSLSSVDVSRATLVVVDAAIEAYEWSEQKIMLSPDAAEAVTDEVLGRVRVPFIMMFDDERLVIGTAAGEFTAARVEGHQLRLGFEELWLSTGEWPQADVLTEFGLANSTIEAIRRHFEETDRLR